MTRRTRQIATLGGPAVTVLVVCLLTAGATTAAAQARDQEGRPPDTDSAGRVQLDVIGEYHFSRFNFTDLKKPYDGVDGFVVVRLGLWLDAGRQIGLFADAIPVVTTEPEFFFQRHVQLNGGVQWYPVGRRDGAVSRLLRPVRLFAQASTRAVYDNPEQVALQDTDVEVGFDYYYDTLFAAEPVAAFLFTTLTYRTTNFSFEGYDGVLWSGNVTVGPKIALGGSSLIPYGVADWTYAHKYSSRFFENFLRMGAGVRWYPFPKPGRPAGFGTDLARRLHVFAELVGNAAWLGDAAPPSVEGHDVRFGVAFATGGFFREPRRNGKQATPSITPAARR